MSNTSLVFSILAALISVGGVFIAIGMFKSKITQNSELIKSLVSKNEFSAAITRGDEQLKAAIDRSNDMLAIMTKRAEEDRTKSQSQYREFHALLNSQENRIVALETHQNIISQAVSELKGDIKSGFKDVQAELKELQNEMKELRKQGQA